MEKINLGIISKNRNTIYGVTTLWIMLFHSSFTFSKDWMAPILRLKNLGNCGVDIFLFVSGISLYFSFVKGNGLKKFYFRRFKRIIPPTLITSALWFAFLSPSKEPDVLSFLLEVTGLSLFTSGHRSIWVVTALLVCYIIYPLLYRIYDNSNYSFAILLYVLIVCLTININLRHFAPTFWRHTEILFRRVPIFAVGAYCGRYVYQKRTLPLRPWQLMLCTATITTLFFVSQPYWSKVVSFRYLYLPLSIIFTLCFSELGNIPLVSKIFSPFAPITLEIYLCQEKYIKLIAKTFPEFISITVNATAFVLAIITAKLLVYINKNLFP